MYFFNRATRGLLWKETRQALPLIGIVTLVGCIVIFVGMIVSAVSIGFTNWIYAISWVLPACYAAGVAALLVGQEKEQRTIWWLSSLPATPRLLIVTKFIVAACGLIVMWVIAAVMAMIAGREYQSSGPPTLSYLASLFGPEYVIQSVLILVLGFFTAWRFRSTFAGLVAVIPLASAPFVSVQLVQGTQSMLTGSRRLSDSASTIWLMSFELFWIAIFGWLGIRTANKALSPDLPRSASRVESSNLLDAWRPTTMRPQPNIPYQYSLNSFLWQSIHSQRWILVAMLGVMLSDAFCLTTVFDEQSWKRRANLEQWFVTMTALAGLSVSWLGVLSFAGDGSAARLRFLADRGVSPWKVWLGRHVVGISILWLVLLTYFFMSWRAITMVTVDDHTPMISVTLLTLGIWTIYVISQWVSQSIPVLAGAVVLAPLVSLAALAWAAYAANELGASIPWLMLCSLLPVAATGLLMRRYMDGRCGWVAVLSPTLVTLGLIIGPAIPFLFDVANVTNISRARMQNLHSLAVNATSPNVSRIGLATTVENNLGSTLFWTPSQRLESYRNAEFGPSNLFSWHADSSLDASALTTENFVTDQVYRSAAYAKVAFNLSPQDQVVQSELRQWIEVIAEFAWRLRKSGKLFDQCAADRMEIWLVEALSGESIRSIPNLDLTQVIRLFQATDRRNEGRRNAVLTSWWYSRQAEQKRHDLYRFGGIAIPALRQQSQARFLLTHQKTKNALTDTLLRFIDAGANGQSTQQLRRELHRIAIGPNLDFEKSLYSDEARQFASFPQGFRSHERIYMGSEQFIGWLWFAPWEEQLTAVAIALKTLANEKQESSQQETTNE